MFQDILIKLPLVNQKRDTHDKKWVSRSCGICSLMMLLEYLEPKHKRLKVMSLIKKGLRRDGYIKNVGWKHSVLVDIADDYGVKMGFQKKFLKTSSEKKNGLIFIEKNIRNKKPVIVSVFYDFNPRKGGHLVVVNGLKLSGRRALGYHVQDPHPLKRGDSYFVTQKEFLKIWRGGMIYLLN